MPDQPEEIPGVQCLPELSTLDIQSQAITEGMATDCSIRYIFGKK